MSSNTIPDYPHKYDSNILGPNEKNWVFMGGSGLILAVIGILRQLNDALYYGTADASHPFRNKLEKIIQSDEFRFEVNTNATWEACIDETIAFFNRMNKALEVQ